MSTPIQQLNVVVINVIRDLRRLAILFEQVLFDRVRTLNCYFTRLHCLFYQCAIDKRSTLFVVNESLRFVQACSVSASVSAAIGNVHPFRVQRFEDGRPDRRTPSIDNRPRWQKCATNEPQTQCLLSGTSDNFFFFFLYRTGKGFRITACYQRWKHGAPNR